MSRKALQTLSEPMYYVLLALTKERYGTEIMTAVKEFSGGRVTIGPGTLYTMLDKFVRNGLIRRTDATSGTKRYLITENGKAALREEYERLRRLADDGREIMEGLR